MRPNINDILNFGPIMRGKKIRFKLYFSFFGVTHKTNLQFTF